MGLGAKLPNHIPACRSKFKMVVRHKLPIQSTALPKYLNYMGNVKKFETL